MSIANLIGTSEESIDRASGRADKPTKNQGRVYCMKFKLDGDVVYKIGKASGKSSIDRFMQVLRSIYLSYKVVPMSRLKRDRKSKDPYGDEKAIHNLLKIYSYEPSERFDGYSEFFKAEEEVILDAYHQVIP